jgi:uncharacterized protein (TIGR03435 family)
MKWAWVIIALLNLTSSYAQITPKFESASIKPTRSTDPRSAYQTNDGHVSIHNKTLNECIRLAYNVKVAQLSGGPKWVDSERYDIEAKASGPADDPRLMAMLQTLLKERFRLEFHRETKMFPGYAIAVAKGGIKIRETEPGPGHTDARRGSIGAQRITMVKFAEALSEMLAVPVIDATGAAGVFTFTLIWTPESAANRPGLSADDPEPSALPNMPEGPSLFAAIQEQLGLKLEGRKGPMQVLVIDRAERPQ